MIHFHDIIDLYVGLFLLILSICIFIVPPKFGNDIYGITTKWTLKSETAWATGQKLFAISILIIGLIFVAMGTLAIRYEIPNFAKVLLLIGLWNLSKYIVAKVIRRKDSAHPKY